MAGSSGNAPDPLTPGAQLEAAAQRFTLFAALRAVERGAPAVPRLGEARKAADEPVRVFQVPHMHFAPVDVAHVGRTGQDRLLIEQYAFGVFGPNGALPLHLTEYADARDRQAGDSTFKDFVNHFQHRLACLFYRAWANADPCASHDRPASDAFRLYLGALVGLGPPAARDADCVLDQAKLARVGLLAPPARSAEALEQLLAEYFGLPVQIVPFAPEWLRIPPDGLCRLGGAAAHATLGTGATLGAATYQRQHRFEIRIGPVRIGRFVSFLPGSRGLEQLVALVRLHTNDEWSWQVRLLLEPEEVPALRLGDSGWLGWASWLGRPQSVTQDTVIEGARPTSAA